MSPATMRSAESTGLQGLCTVGVEAGFLTKTAAMDIALLRKLFFLSHRKSTDAASWAEFICETVYVAYPQFAQSRTNRAPESTPDIFAGKAWSIYPRR